MTSPSHAACARIYEQWHEYAKSRDVEKLLALYVADAVLESPLVPAILDDAPTGVLRGHGEIRRFLAEGTARRPNNLVRWYRTGRYFTDGATLIWEYPRETPDGDQVDLVEAMDIRDGKIAVHRIYWGWFGTSILVQSALSKEAKARATPSPSSSPPRGEGGPRAAGG